MQKQQEYISQLDGLRAFAVALVVLFHWFPEGEGINVIANGPVGVTLFFVLSGFLITRILLANRNHLAEHGLGATYKTFMFRRILRIFPLYYLTLLVIWCIQYIDFIPQVPSRLYDYPLYYVLYISNFLIEKLHDWSDVLSPFWSLAVEEQFYIIWPFVVLTVPQRFLKGTLIGTVVLGIASRGVLATLGYSDGVLMPTCLDAFGLGGIWAYVSYYDKSVEKFLKILNVLAILGLAVFVYICLNNTDSWLKTLFFRTSMSLFCLYLVARASYKKGFPSVIGSILDNGFMRHIGRISYGLYVYHMLVPTLVVPFIIKFLHRFLHITLTFSENSLKMVSLVVLVLLATVSWYLFENPFIRLKRYFQLSRVKRTPSISPISK
ncbi:acyltransferase family protein [Dyadobacter aurulentus]|uniref:acyltransferase family protein n=1 Tax=Dyadobacter sp. UC 10 TaxID=2605428 RepID=UPI0011F1A11A|nr:acyltransferase [Dyadobacter sp. UC 10]KAA0991564.1 acyltransferase [Dyadobacter sp. UC 10]